MWYGFRFHPDLSDGHPPKLDASPDPGVNHRHPYTDEDDLAEYGGWHNLIRTDSLILSVALDDDSPACRAAGGREFILWIKKP